MKYCQNPKCKKEIPENRQYCSHTCQCSYVGSLCLQKRKGKTNEELYGSEVAKRMSILNSLSKKDKTYEEICGNLEKAKTYKSKISLLFKGKQKSPEHKLKIQKMNLGRKHTLESRKNMSVAQKGTHRPGVSVALKGKKLSREHVRKMLRRRKMSSLEVRMLDIITKNNLPYKFVGNGEFLIENKCPDFININGQKIAIEVYSRTHKDLFRGGYLQWMEDRKQLFAKYGWTVKFFDPLQLQNESQILSDLEN